MLEFQLEFSFGNEDRSFQRASEITRRVHPVIRAVGRNDSCELSALPVTRLLSRKLVVSVNVNKVKALGADMKKAEMLMERQHMVGKRAQNDKMQEKIEVSCLER